MCWILKVDVPHKDDVYEKRSSIKEVAKKEFNLERAQAVAKLANAYYAEK